MKRTIQHPEKFIGKKISTTKWEIPCGWNLCAMTGKFYPESKLEVTFCHHCFDKRFLVINGIYIEDADWLSEEGYDLIINKLNTLGITRSDYLNRSFDFYTRKAA